MVHKWLARGRYNSRVPVIEKVRFWFVDLVFCLPISIGFAEEEDGYERDVAWLSGSRVGGTLALIY